MSARSVYSRVQRLLSESVDASVHQPTIKRLALLVTGMIRARSAAPARVAQAAYELQLSDAEAESIERRLRRTENDAQVTAELCFHPLARQHLRWGQPPALLLILDPTLQEDRAVMVAANVWYRGRSLPLAWTLWPANTPLEGAGFWQRVAALLAQVATLLPLGVPVTWLADRAFGTPAFTDLLVAHGWHYVVRSQGQTHYRDCLGREQEVQALVSQRTERRKLRGWVFKKAGWRAASVVVYWGRRHDKALCLVSDLPPQWQLIALYRRRYPIEGTFRDYKACGWQWEQGQVRDLRHLERWLVAMALATWLALLAGTQVATELLAQPASGRRHTRPWAGKYSLFHLGLLRLQQVLAGRAQRWLPAHLSHWDAPNWQTQITDHHSRAFLWAWHSRSDLVRMLTCRSQKTVRP